MKQCLKFAHVEGHTDLTYTDDGLNIITCGADGDYRVWKGFEDDDPECVRVGDEATCIAYKNNRIYVGTDMQVLQIYSFPDNQMDGLVTRFTSTITHTTFNKEGTKVAAGSSDMTIKVCDVSGKGQVRDLVLEGHSAPILSVSFDPRSEYLASSSCDGTIRLWSMSSGKQIHCWPWGPKSNDFGNSPSLCRVHFEPNGRFLAVPAFPSSTVKILDRATWKEILELSDDRLKDISICCWSPCGKYLASSSKAGDIVVFDVKAKSVVYHFQHEKKVQICNLAWNPAKDSKEIAFCDARGHLGLLENVTGQPMVEPAKANAVNAAPVEHANNYGVLEDDDDAEFSISQIKKATGFVEEDGRDVFAGSRPMDVDSLMDEVASKSSSRPSSPFATSSRRLNYPSSKKQEPFQPGSSPVHLQHRYMIWNNVGIVRCFGDEADSSSNGSIEVEFHDTSVHHGLHIPNTLGHTMAALSTQALVLACPAQDDSSPSKIVCVNFASWDGQREWSTSLPSGEEVVALAVGEFWVAAATSRRFLRFFSTSGLQRAVIAMPGPVVCLAGFGSKLLMTYHLAMGLPGDQSLGWALINVERRSPVGYKWLASPQPLPLGPDCDLSWAGFSDEGTAAVMDSCGLLQLQTAPGMWAPTVDTRQNIKGKSDHYFIIGVSELEKNVRCILCKGARYPPTLPRPNLAILDIRLPLCDSGNEKTQLEESLIQTTVQFALAAAMDGFDAADARDKAEKSSKESLMKMFALACQADREVRAMEVAEWMNSEQMLQLAIKYATRARKRQLANRLTERAEQMLREREEEEQEDAVNDVTIVSGSSSQYSSVGYNSTYPDEDRDMFATSQSSAVEVEDNPILQAKQRKASVTSMDAAKINTIRPLTQNKKNPFAKKAEAPSPTPSPRGLAIFDQPAKVSSLGAKSSSAKENVKTKVSKQPTLFGMGKKTTPAAKEATDECPSEADGEAPAKTGFMLWMDVNRDELQTENPDASESELVRIGAKKFRTLTEDERQKYSRKRKSSDSAEKSEEAPKKNRPTLAEKLSGFEA